MPTLNIYTSPVGSQLTSTINKSATPPEPDDKNDFAVYITGNGNFTLEQSDVGLTTGYSIQSFEGAGCSYKAVIRPPTTAGVLTISIANNAVPEGNSAVSQTIRMSTSFPDTDAEAPTQGFAHNLSALGIAVTPTEIKIKTSTSGPNRTHINNFNFAGTALNTETIPSSLRNVRNGLDVLNGDYLFRATSGPYRINGQDLSFDYLGGSAYSNLSHSRYGYISYDSFNTVLYLGMHTYDDFTEAHRFDEAAVGTTSQADSAFAVQDDLVYTFNNRSLYQLKSFTEIELLRRLNIATITNQRGAAIYRDTLYLVSTTHVYTLDIRPYRPMSRNTKTTIYPQFIKPGQSLDLSLFAPDADRFIFDVGFDKPSWLSISGTQLSVASDATTGVQPVLLKVRAINYIDSIGFTFYLIIEADTAPVWRDVDSLSMKENSTYNLHQIVEADSIVLQSGPTGSSVSDSVFTLGTTDGAATFRATKDGLTTDKTIEIDRIQAPTPANFSDTFRYTVKIANIDVTEDLLKANPLRVSKSSDNIELTRYRADSVSIALSNANDKYDPDAADNFWDQNSLNPGGYQEEIKVYMENLISGSWTSHLLFSGIIQNQATVVSAVQVNLTAVDVSVLLERSAISDFGVSTKWDTLRKLSDEESFESVYVPEGSLLPIQPKTAEAYHDRTKLTRSSLQLPTHGPPLTNTMYVSASDVRVSGGFFEEGLSVAKFKTYPRSQDVVSLLNLLAIAGTIYNTEIEVPAVTLDAPTFFNQGSVPFAVEATRTTRLPVDWVHDATNDRLLELLSNPEGHIADLLVQWDIERKSYRVLHTFDKDVKAHRIERRDATNYYILTSGAIPQDRSAQTLPRQSDGTGYVYDSVSEGSAIKVYHYNSSTDTLTEHVAEDNTYPAQLGIHYWTGFENSLYTDEFEGITPYDRGAFKWHSGNLYYRYAKDGAFGVARVNAGGTTSEMIDQTELNHQNHLNFAFDVTSTGDIYFVYATGNSSQSSLVIKRRTSGGTESTLLTDTKAFSALTALDAGGGAYLGAHECLFHNNQLYILAPIQRVNKDDSTDPATYSRAKEKTAGMVLYRCDVTAGTPSLTVIEKWDFLHLAGCGLVVHDGNVHYIEQPIVASQFKAYNPDLEDTYRDAMGYNVLPESIGALKKINADGTVEDLGNLWYEGDYAYNQALTRTLSIDGDLHVMLGYGNTRELLKYNSLASKADNCVHIRYGTNLQFLLPTFQPTGNIYSELANIARKIGAILSFDGNLISIKDRRALRAKVQGTLTANATTLAFDTANRTFPGSGNLRIGTEFLSYTGISGGSFTGVTRGVLGTAAAAHADEADILFVDALVPSEEILDINRNIDTTRYFNKVEDGSDIFEVSDTAGIEKYNERAYTLDLGVTRNENAWLETMFEQYLSELKTLGKQLNLTLTAGKTANALDVGQVIGVADRGRVESLRIDSITYSQQHVNISARTVGG